MAPTFCRKCKLEPPQATSLPGYHAMEAGLVMAAIVSIGKSGPIQLSPKQEEAAVKLTQGIKDDYTGSKCNKLLHGLLLSLYAPEDISGLAIDVFSSPVIAFLAVQCKSELGTYHSASKLGQDTAKIQTCIRFRFLGHLMRDLQVACYEGTDNEWIEYGIPLAFVH